MTESSNSSFAVGELLVEPALDQISRGSKRASLRPQVMEVLVYLASRGGEVVGAHELLDNLWKGKVVTDGTVYSCIADLRHAIAGLDDHQPYIETIPKKGYRLLTSVTKSGDKTGSSEPKHRPASSIDSAPRFRHRNVAASIVALLGLLTLAMVARDYFPFARPIDATQTDHPVRRFTIELPRYMLNFDIQYRPVTISPDGRRVIFSGVVDQLAQLYSRSIDSLDVSPIKGTKNAASVVALSPDGEWIVFVDQSDAMLKKMSSAGGVPIKLCDPGGRVWGLSWGKNDLVVYESNAYKGLMQVSSHGGKPKALTIPKNGNVHKQPSFSPDGGAVFFTVGDRGSTTRKTDRIAVVSLESGVQKTLMFGASPRAAPNGLLIYYLEHALWAVAFDPDRLEVTSESVPVADDVHYDTDAHFSFSNDGTLVYVIDTNLMRRVLVWVDRFGNEETLPFEPMPFVSPRIAPDGNRIAVVVDSIHGADLWVYSLDRERRTRLTYDESREAAPVWSRDGESIFYSSNRIDNLFRVTTDGRGAIEQLTSSPNYQFAYSTAPDDRLLLFSEGPSNTLPTELATLELSGERITDSLLETGFSEFDPAISPDGKWLAYSSTRAGKTEVYVRPFPNVYDSAWQISVGGGTQPVWGPSGKNLVYWGPTDLMIVAIEAASDFGERRPEPVINHRDFVYYDMRNFDVGPSGKRFLMVKKWFEDDIPINRIVLVQNWLEDVTRKIEAN